MLHRVELAEVVRKDPRYPFEAYDFVFDALLHTRKLLGRLAEDPAREGERECHVSGPELLAGVRDPRPSRVRHDGPHGLPHVGH